MGAGRPAKKRVLQGDAELNYAFAALREFGVLPGTFAALPKREKAAVIAFINLLAEE